MGRQRPCVAPDPCGGAAPRHRSSEKYVGPSRCAVVAGDFRRIRSSRHDAFVIAAHAGRYRLSLRMGACAAVDDCALRRVSLASAGGLADTVRGAALLAAAHALSFAAIRHDGIGGGVVCCRWTRLRHVAMVVSAGGCRGLRSAPDQRGFVHEGDLFAQLEDAVLPIALRVEPREGGREGRVVPAAGEPGAVVKQAQRSQGFRQM